MKRKTILIYGMLLVLSGLFAEETFTAVFSGFENDFNPHSTFTSTEAQLYTAIFEGLFSYHPLTLEPVPAAAESWTVSEDGLTYVFTLRENLTYSNGDSVTAGHFKDSWLKLISPGIGSEYGSLLDLIKNAEEYRTGRGPSSEVGIRVLSPRELSITLEYRAPHLLKVLCHHSFAPIHPDQLWEQDWSSESIIVNGPYTLLENNVESLKFKKNEHYWDKDNVSIENILIHFSDNAEENARQYNRGSIDWLTDSFDLNIINISEAVLLNPLFSTSYLFFSNREKPWDNEKVRQALALLLPWEQIRSTQMIPGSTLIPSITGYPEAQGIEKANREMALSLLDESGFAAGKGLPPLKLRMPESRTMLQIAELMAETWQRELGLEVTIDSEPYPHYFNSLKKDDYTIGALTWIGDYADPMTFLEMWLNSSSLNDARYENPEYDALVRKSSEVSLEDRYKIMSEAESILLNSAQVMPLGHFPALNIIDLRFIEGWHPNVLDIHPFKYLKFSEGILIPGSV